MKESPKSKVQSPKLVWDKKLIKKWLPVDFYIGGAEHAVLHLLYSRFWIKVLYDAKIINFDEPFLKLRTIGLILAPDGQKMSKSRGNVINPDDIVAQYDADTFRVYEMFIGPFDQSISWDTKGILGAKRFLDKVSQTKTADKTDEAVKKELHRTIKKVTEDIQNQKFNTAIAAMMEFVNLLQGKTINKKDFGDFLKILAPFAPHLAEELWQEIHNISVNQYNYQRKSVFIFEERWPDYDPKLIEEEKFTLIVQVNGKVRDQIEAKIGISEKEAKDLAFQSEKIQKWLEGKEIKKTIFLKDKLINFVI